VQRFLPYNVVVLFRERRAGDLSMVSPHCTLSRHDILPVDVNAGVDPDGLREIIAPGGDLSNSFRIGNIQCVCSRGDNQVDITANLTE
jgi:hypothetical protein